MADWATISSLATAGGTLVLAVATFASVRSANRSARIAEMGLREQRRPVLVHSRLDDPEQKIVFGDGRWVRAGGAQAVAESDGDVLYFAMSLRNVGAGIAVLHGWYAWPERQAARSDHAPLEDFRVTVRDLYVAPGDIGLWQGALRDSSEAIHGDMGAALAERRTVAIDLLYSDQVGEQRSVSRFSISPGGDGRWICSVVRHWNLDAPGPR